MGRSMLQMVSAGPWHLRHMALQAQAGNLLHVCTLSDDVMVSSWSHWSYFLDFVRRCKPHVASSWWSLVKVNWVMDSRYLRCPFRPISLLVRQVIFTFYLEQVILMTRDRFSHRRFCRLCYRVIVYLNSLSDRRTGSSVQSAPSFRLWARPYWRPISFDPSRLCFFNFVLFDVFTRPGDDILLFILPSRSWLSQIHQLALFCSRAFLLIVGLKQGLALIGN